MDHSINKKELQAEIDNKARSFYSSDDALAGLIASTLENFAYRYLDSESSERESCALINSDHYEVKVLETSLVEALKVGHPDSKKKLIEFAKTSNIKEKPAVCFFLGTRLSSMTSQGGGEAKLYVEINYDFPKFDRSSDKLIKREYLFEFDDVLVFRNEYAKHLESVAEIL